MRFARLRSSIALRALSAVQAQEKVVLGMSGWTGFRR